MSDEQQEAGGQVEAVEQLVGPGWLAPGSDEAAYQEQIGEVVARYPELTRREVAQAASETAAHMADRIGDPTLAGDPTILAAAHAANMHEAQVAGVSAAHEAAQRQAPPMDADAYMARITRNKVLPY